MKGTVTLIGNLQGGTTFRTLTLKDGGSIEEKLLVSDDTSYSYEIVESQLPVKNYKATLSVEEDEDSPDRSEIHWEATFDAQGASEEDATKKIADIFEEGVAGMKKAALDYEAKNGDASGGASSNGGPKGTDGDEK